MTAPLHSDNTTLDEALDHIKAEPTIWVRTAALRDDENGGWKVRVMELVSGAPPPSWEYHVWEYPKTLFTAQAVSGDEVADGLRAGAIAIRQHRLELPELTTSCHWDRLQSQQPGRMERLDWPTTETSLIIMTSTSEPQGMLLSDGDAPSFLTFYAAAAAFFWQDRQPVGGRVSPEILYRHQDTRGRIVAVRLSTDSVEVDLEGNALNRMIVELPGQVPGRQQVIWQKHGEPVTIPFELKEPLPLGTWALLRNGSEYVDRRFWSLPHQQGVDAGVEFVIDPVSRLEALVSSPERQQVEFKRQVPSKDEDKRKIMKTVCAFANGDGGSVLIGVDDERQVIGVDRAAYPRLCDALTQMIGTWLDHRPPTQYEALPVGDSDKVVLELQVLPGQQVYSCGRSSETRTVYVRHHSVTERATTAEIITLTQARLASPSSAVPYSYLPQGY